MLESHVALLQHLKTVNHAGKIIESNLCICQELDKCMNGEHGPTCGKRPWQDDKYLTPVLERDPLLYSFELDINDDTDEQILLDEDVMSLLDDKEVESSMLTASDQSDAEGLIECAISEVKALAIDDDLRTSETIGIKGKQLRGLLPENGFGFGQSQEVEMANNGVATDNVLPLAKKKQKNNLKVSFAEVAAKERFSINQSYFGSYSTFGIHREMLSDKIRTDAYEHAITRNSSLLEGAVVMDLGCGTGILSLFAAKAGAKKVIAVEGSKKMSLMAQQVAKANGYWNEHTQESGDCRREGVIMVVQGMIEELDLGSLIECDRVDVLVSEWMGYCLLFESMLNSVLFARDRWLKPGGAILPDVAEMYVAGFGIGGTSLPFWENVYGFDMKCIGREVLEDAASSLIVDAIDSKDVVTDACLLQAFDLVTMVEQDVDFTALFELKPCASCLQESGEKTLDCNGRVTQKNGEYVWCYGLVLWFDTRFTGRFCQENPVLLSTSPHSPKTHWSQTLLTFREPVCLSVVQKLAQVMAKAESVGTASLPASFLKGRISIARSSRHRSIDISLEMVAVGETGVVRQWPVQMFDM